MLSHWLRVTYTCEACFRDSKKVLSYLVLVHYEIHPYVVYETTVSCAINFFMLLRKLPLVTAVT